MARFLRGLPLLLVLACAGVTASCGETTDPLVGLYAVDVAKTLETAAAAEEDPWANWLVDLGPQTYQLLLLDTGRFVLSMDFGEQAMTVKGAWKGSEGGIEIVTDTVDGWPNPEAERRTETLPLRDGRLVIVLGERTVYLARAP